MSEGNRPPDDPGARIEELLRQQGLGHDSDGGVTGAGAVEAEEAAPADPLDRVLADPRVAGSGDVGSGAEAGEPAPEGAAAADEPADPLPDAPLFALLRTVEREVGIDRIDRIWVFPPRRLETGETAVVVVAAFPEVQADRRRVYAAHYTAPADATPPRLALNEYGTAPAERVGRLVEDVVERLKDQPAAPPRSWGIAGSDVRWHEALHELAEAHLEEAGKNPRLRG